MFDDTAKCYNYLTIPKPMPIYFKTAALDFSKVIINRASVSRYFEDSETPTIYPQMINNSFINTRKPHTKYKKFGWSLLSEHQNAS